MVKPGRSLVQVESKWNKTGVHVCFIESCDRRSYVDGNQWTVLGFSTAGDGRRVKFPLSALSDGEEVVSGHS